MSAIDAIIQLGKKLVKMSLTLPVESRLAVHVLKVKRQ